MDLIKLFNKVNYLKIAAQYYETKKNFIEAANWYNKVVGVKKIPTKYDFNTVGLNYYKGGVTPDPTASNADKLTKQRFYTFRYAYQPNGSKTF